MKNLSDLINFPSNVSTPAGMPNKTVNIVWETTKTS